MPPSRPWLPDHEAASGVVAFMVGMVVFIASVGAILLAANHAGSGHIGDPQQAAQTKTQAGSIADLVLGSPGHVANGTDWASSAAGVQVCTGWACLDSADGVATGRLGLGDASAPDSSYVSFKKLQNLRNAPLAANPTDGYVNYDEAAAALGVGAGHGFHLRSFPTLDGVDQVLHSGIRDPNLRVTYVGAISETAGAPPSNPGAGLGATQLTCTKSSYPNAYHIATNVTNGGTTATLFEGVFSVTFSKGIFYGNDADTVLVQPGATAPLAVDVPAYEGSEERACGQGTLLNVTILDANLVRLTSLDHTVTSSEAVSVDDTTSDLYFDTPQTSVLPGQAFTINYYGATLAQNQKLTLRLYNGTSDAGTLISSLAITVPKQVNKRNVQLTIASAGQYAAYLYNSASPTGSTLRSSELLLAATPAPGGYSAAVPTGGAPTYVVNGTVGNEVAMLDTLVTNFCPTYADSKVSTPVTYAVNWTQRCSSFKSSSPPTPDLFGDVLAQQPLVPKNLATALQDRLVDAAGNPTLNLTRILVIGSNVQHSYLSPGGAKNTIAAWVQAGGMLVVFGSPNGQSNTWLQPICGAKIQSSNGGVSSPDSGNPILTTPNTLDWASFSNGGNVWNFNNGKTCGYFTNIVVDQAGNPILTVSNAGSYGSGRVILTTWRAFDIYGGSKDAATTYKEGMMVIDNFLTQAYQDLFLDYGPEIPAHTNVIPDVRQVQVTDPEFANPIQLTVIVYAW
ncbi:MAG: hypothetical protein ACYDBQ_09455 [Thermoplasmatota archaeon]